MDSSLIPLLTLISEFLLLFILSQSLVRSLGRLFFLLTKSQRATIHLLAFLFLPGTIIHELAHVISAGVMLVHTGHVEFMPEVHEDGVKLGSAEIGKTDPFRRSLIGVAPFLIGSAIILGSLFYLSSNILSGVSYTFWFYLLVTYIIFVIGNTMFSSKKDLEGISLILVLGVSFTIAAYLLGFGDKLLGLVQYVSEQNSRFIQKSNLLLLIPLVINLSIIGFAKLIIHRGYNR